MSEQLEKYQELWRVANARRDFELTHLWQRSILLTALIVVICSSYVGFVSKAFDTEKSIDPLVFNEIACFITLVGLLFSLAWIMMGKGSKAWFEIQEKRIRLLEDKLFDDTFDGFKMDDDCSLKEIDACILSTKAGKYSPSRLNIFIGIALSILWTILFVAHFVMLSKDLGGVFCCCHCWIAMGLFLVFLLIVVTASCNVWAKSHALVREK